ncbi:MAG: hypothetical protein VR64_19555 [Desulfatitalea sp. BRH_c12]|nr:MAG: hypothetical protein VR64_19555 [Desulfatitalea sp. BRH_c12]
MTAYAIKLAYGSVLHPFHFKRPPHLISATEPACVIDLSSFRERLDRFLEDATLDLRQAVVVVADKTRVCGYPHYLPVLVDALRAHGGNDSLTLCIAYGTHAAQDAATCRHAYGPVFDRCHWVHHNCDRNADFVDLGRTRRGTPVRLSRHIMEASCVITMGAVNHHYFAGYGGGRKLIFPGLGERHAIYANHGLFLDRTRRGLSAGCQPGVLAGNPLAEDLADIETHRPADLAVHGILDSHGQVCDLRVGRGRDHFLNACALHASHCEVPDPRHDLVVASCGGYPKDINFIQSHKAIHNAAAFVRDGGRLIVLAQCRDGIGSQTFLPWFEMGWNAAFDRLADNYVGNGGTALAMMAKLRRIRISVVTDLAGALADRVGFEPLPVEQAARLAADYTGQAAVIPNAGMIVRKNR